MTELKEKLGCLISSPPENIAFIVLYPRRVTHVELLNH